MSRIQYALFTWGGFVSCEMKDKIGAFFLVQIGLVFVMHSLLMDYCFLLITIYSELCIIVISVNIVSV